MRERLLELMIDAKRTDPEDGKFSEWLADYLLEHGVILPPVKVGDRVYHVLNDTVLPIGNYVCEEEIVSVCDRGFISDIPGRERESYEEMYWQGVFIPYDELGISTFLTREEAEEKVRRLNNG